MAATNEEAVLEDRVHALVAELRRLRESEACAQLAARRTAQLEEVASSLGAALTVREVIDGFLSLSVRLFEAAAGIVYLVDGEGRFRLAGAVGLDSLPDGLKELDPDAPLPLAEALRTRAPVWFGDYDQLLARYPNLVAARTPADRLQAVAALPLLQGSRLLGGFALSFHRPFQFDRNEQSWLGRFASHLALAVQRARSYAAEQDARAEAETLLRAAQALTARQLDMDAIIKQVTDEATAVVGATFGAFAPNFTGKASVRLGDVAQNGRSGTLPTHEGMPVGHLPVTSYLAVPVVSGNGSVLGALAFGHPEPDRFTAQHERLVTALASHAAAALDNARLYKQARAAEDNHRHLVDELTETVRMNETLAGVLAHDLRNPLNAIMTAAQLAMTRTSSENLSKPLGRILASGERMARMVDQLLDLARIRLGKGLLLEPKPVDLLPMVRHVIDELDAPAAERDVQLTSQGDTAGRWDEDRLAQIFSNLVGNALNHRTGGSVQVAIDGREADLIRVRVHNQGAIAAELLPKLFAPLAAGEHRRTRSSGLGLGLFITQQIVKAHGGRIEVTSNEADGTSFVVELPRFLGDVAAQRSPAPAPGPPSKTLARNAEEEIRRSEERFRLMVEAVKDYAIFMLDPTGHVATWNLGAERLKGYRREEIIGQHFSRFYPPEVVRTGLCERELELADREGRFEDEGWRVRKDGTQFWANVVITSVRDGTGKLMGFTKVTRDLTERRKLEQERLRLAQAQEGIRLRDEFLSLVSHELKTPLAGLQMQLELLEKKIDSADERIAQKLRRAVMSGDRLSDLIDSILDVSQIGIGRFEIEPMQLDLSELAAEVIERLRPQATAANSRIVTRIDGPLIGFWDRARIAQMLTNLMSNAIKYGAGHTIMVSAQAVGAEVVLEVRDHGTGIEAADLPRLFDRFERAASTRHYGGLGLGLYLVREIARAHGGSAAAENAPGGGASFRVRLPFEPRPPIVVSSADREYQ